MPEDRSIHSPPDAPVDPADERRRKAQWTIRQTRSKLHSGILFGLVFGLFMLGYTVVTWNDPTTCGGQTMYDGDLCAVEEYEVEGRHGSKTKQRQTLLSESDFPSVPRPADGDWENVQPGDKLTMSSPWELIGSSANVRTFDEHRAATARNRRGLLIGSGMALAASAAFFLPWYLLRKRAE